ncbi:MAG: endo-1,4-beta-xylanase, partial [Anaerolineae bacterium]
YNLDPSLFPEQYRSLAGPIPLFIAQQNEKGEWGWKENTFLLQYKIIGDMKAGFSWDGRERNLIFSERIPAVVVPSPSYIHENGGDTYFNQLARNLEAAGIDFISPHGFFHWYHLGKNPTYPPDRFDSKEKILSWMTERIDAFYKQLPGIDYFIVVNEPVYYSGGSIGWENSPYYNYLGEKWPEIAFRIAIQKAIENGVDLNQITFVWNDYGAEIKGPKSQYINTYLSRIKSKFAQEFGREVNMAVGLQFHVTTDPQKRVTWGGPYIGEMSYDNLVSNFRSFNVPVLITEFSVKGANDTTPDSLTQAQVAQLVIRAALDSGNVVSFTWWESMHENNMFDTSGNPLLPYYVILKEMSLHSLENQ